MRPRRWILFVLLPCLAAARAVAQPSPPPIDEVMRKLAAVPENRARFVEEKTIAALSQPLRSEGFLVYRRPDHLEKTTTTPVKESLTVDGSRLVVTEAAETPRLIDLASEPAVGALVDAVRGTLAGDLSVLRRSYAVSAQGSALSWRLTLVPTAPALAGLIREIVVDGSNADLRSVWTAQANGDQSLMTISPAH